MKIKSKNLVGIIMGSKSDWGTMKFCSDTLKEFNIKHYVNTRCRRIENILLNIEQIIIN